MLITICAYMSNPACKRYRSAEIKYVYEYIYANVFLFAIAYKIISVS